MKKVSQIIFFSLVFVALLCVRCVSSRVSWVPWGTSVYVCMCVCVCVVRLPATVDRPPGPVTAGVLFVSRGPLLAQTALLWDASCCESPIHTDTCTHIHKHTQPHTPWSLVALSLGAVQPGHSRGHLPFTEGESCNI